MNRFVGENVSPVGNKSRVKMVNGSKSYLCGGSRRLGERELVRCMVAPQTRNQTEWTSMVRQAIEAATEDSLERRNAGIEVDNVAVVLVCPDDDAMMKILIGVRRLQPTIRANCEANHWDIRFEIMSG